jgi:hypothetical protein
MMLGGDGKSNVFLCMVGLWWGYGYMVMMMEGRDIHSIMHTFGVSIGMVPDTRLPGAYFLDTPSLEPGLDFDYLYLIPSFVMNQEYAMVYISHQWEWRKGRFSLTSNSS